MTLIDTINGFFLLGSSVAVLGHCHSAYRSKSAKGASLNALVFFTAWAVWNLFYYNALGQLFSFFCGIAAVFTNALYLWLLFHYSRREK